MPEPERQHQAAEHPPRCTIPGCPVRYRDGSDRPCREHATDRDAIAYDMTRSAWDPAGNAS